MFHKPLTLWLPLEPGVSVRMTLEVTEEPLGGLDQDIHRQPTLPEMEQISQAIAARTWSFTKP